MSRTIGALCTLVVGLQILVGVPLIVCVLFFAVARGGVGPVAVEMHAGPGGLVPATVGPAQPIAPATIVTAPPPNLIPNSQSAALDNPILEARAQHGSPLAGTVLGESVDAGTEQQLFVAAFENAPAEGFQGPIRNAAAVDAKPDVVCADLAPSAAALREKTTQFAIRQLYAVADMDELAGLFERADQWRSLARELRGATAVVGAAPPCPAQ